MALTKTVTVDRIEILENGSLQLRTKTSIQEDGVELSSSYRRESRTPGADVSSYSDRVQAIAAASWTADVVEAYNAAVAAAEASALLGDE